MDRERIVLSADEMRSLGESLGSRLAPDTILALKGNLGAGKTTFVQGLALGLGIDQPILSPTYVYLNAYEGRVPLFHFDLYRLKDEKEFLSLGFDEYLDQGGICAIEWSERIEALLPKKTVVITFIARDETTREIKIEGDRDVTAE